MTALGNVADNVGVSTDYAYGDYRRLAFAQKLLIEADVKNTKGGIHRTRNCHAVRKFNADSIELKISQDANNSKASFSGLQTCGSVWTCPVCSKRLGVERSKEIKKLLEWSRNNKFTPIMITLTASHHKRMGLVDFKAKFKRAWRKFAQSTVWRRLKATLQIKHSVKANEVTHGFENGWHYHSHGLLLVPNAVLMALDESELETWKDDVAKQWIKCLEKVGLTGLLPYACNIVSDHSVGEKYLAKLGLEDETTHAEFELTSGRNKDYKGRNIWYILRKASEGDKDYQRLYVEFAEAMQNEFWILWSDHLKDIVGVEEKSDEEISETDDLSEMFTHLMDISDEKFYFVRHQRVYADLLTVAATTRDEKQVNEYLKLVEKAYYARTFQHDIQRLQEQYQSLKEQVFDYARYHRHYSGNKKYTQEKLDNLIRRRDATKQRLDMLKQGQVAF